MKIISKNRAAHGVLKRVEITSQSLGGARTIFAIYLPDSCTEENKLPVVYYLSGLTCTDENFCQKGGAFQAACDNEVVLVMPDTSPRGEDIPDEEPKEYCFGVGASFYLNATTKKYRKHFNMYDYILTELPDFVEQNFPVSSKRAITGHSMGGHGALTIALKNSDKYESVSAFAPICNPTAVPWGKKAFSLYLGEDETIWKEYDATELIKNYGGKKDLHILCDQGLADSFLRVQLSPDNFIAAAKDAGVEVMFRMHEEYDHSYYFVSSFISEHLAHHAKFLHLAQKNNQGPEDSELSDGRCDNRKQLDEKDEAEAKQKEPEDSATIPAISDDVAEPPAKKPKLQTLDSAGDQLKAMIEETQSSLQALGHLQECMDASEVFQATETIFGRFDVDSNGVLEGDEYTACIDALVAHMKSKFEEELRRVIESNVDKDQCDSVLSDIMQKRFKGETMRQVVIEIVDPNQDGKITRDEALAGFKQVVDKLNKDK